MVFKIGNFVVSAEYKCYNEVKVVRSEQKINVAIMYTCTSI